MKKIYAILALGLLAALVTGCGGAAEEPYFAAPGGREAPAEEEAEAEEAAPAEEAAEEEEAIGDYAYEEEAEMEPLVEFQSSGATPLPLPTASAAALAPGETLANEPELLDDAASTQDRGRALPDTMIFQDYGASPFFDAAKDNLSTFAVDVDTGSYTVTRNYLNDYFLPPPEAVRTEEFINYFEQDYPQPRDGMFHVDMEGAPTPFNGPSRYVMRVGVQGYEVSADERPDATLIFVVDVSGSMDRENRLEAVKESLITLTSQLRPTDQVGLVVYGSRGRVLLDPTPVSQSRRILRAIGGLRPGGSTNAEEGLLLAYDMALDAYDPNRINRIILCSDGVANVGATGPDAILERVRQYALDDITLTTVGYGMGNYNDVLMEQLADDGNGQYYYVDTLRESERIFVDELTGTLLTIGRDAKIQVEFNPSTVAYYRLMGYENRDVADQDFRNDSVDAGEIGAGHSVTALYEVIPTLRAGGAIAVARLRWEDPETREVIEISRTLHSEDVAVSFNEASPRFRQDVAVAAFAEVLGESGWASHTTMEDVWPVAIDVANSLPNDFDVQEFSFLVERAAELQPY
jgi:Ca-activated chloride channel family protein